MKKLLVLGVGNILMMDEGFGVHVVHELLKESWPEEMDLLDGGTFTQDIFYIFTEYQKILVLDIVRGGCSPGTIYRLSENDLRKNSDQSLSLHDIDLLDSLGMARLAGKNPELHVIGIEPEKIDWSIELSPRLTGCFNIYIEIVRKEIASLIETSDS